MQYDRIYLFRRENGVYYLRFRKAGKETWKSTGCKLKSEALKVLRSYKKAVEDDTPLDPSLIDFPSFKRQILDYAAGNYSEQTHLLYKLALRRLKERFPNIQPNQFTPLHADEYKLWRMKTVKPVTVNIELRTLRAAFNHAVRWGIVERNPFSGVKQIQIPERIPPYFRPEQFRRLLDETEDPWLSDVVVFAVSTGIRQGELRHLRWHQVSLENRRILIEPYGEFKTKTGRTRVVPLNTDAEAVLQRRKEIEGEDDLVFTFEGRKIRRDTLTHSFKRAVLNAGLPGHLHFHSLRHTFASWLVQDGVSLYQVGRLLGHTTARTTEIYAHLQPETMHDVVDRLTLSD